MRAAVRTRAFGCGFPAEKPSPSRGHGGDLAGKAQQDLDRPRILTPGEGRRRILTLLPGRGARQQLGAQHSQDGKSPGRQAATLTSWHQQGGNTLEWTWRLSQTRSAGDRRTTLETQACPKAGQRC